MDDQDKFAKIIEAVKNRTPEQKAADKARFDEMIERHRKSRCQTEAAKIALMDVLKEHYPQHDERRLDAPEVLAHILHYFDRDGEMPVNRLYLNWLIDEYVQTEVLAMLPVIDDVIARLIYGNHTQWNKCDFPTDGCAYILEAAPHRQVMVIEDHGRGMIYIRNVQEPRRWEIENGFPVYGNGLHICQFWRLWADCVEEDPEYCAETEAELKADIAKEGMLFWIREVAAPFQHEFSDWDPHRMDAWGKKVATPERPHLQWFIDRKFNDLAYGDSRDGFHIYRLGTIDTDRHTRMNIARIASALFCVECLLSHLKSP